MLAPSSPPPLARRRADSDDDDDGLSDLSLSNMDFHFSYPSPVKPSLPPSPPPSQSPPPPPPPPLPLPSDELLTRVGGSAPRRTTAAAPAKGLEASVTGFSPGPSERRERAAAAGSSRLLASRSAGNVVGLGEKENADVAGSAGALGNRPARAMDRYLSKSQSEFTPSLPSPSYSSTSSTSSPRTYHDPTSQTTMTTSSTTIRAPLASSSATPGASTARHKLSASASGSLGGSTSVKHSRLLGGAVRVTPEERRRRVEELEREEREREAREAALRAQAVKEEDEEPEQDADGRSPESVGSLRSAETRDGEGSSARSSPAGTTVSSSSAYGDSPRVGYDAATPPQLGQAYAHQHPHQQHQQRPSSTQLPHATLSAPPPNGSSRSRGPSPIPRDYAPPSPPPHPSSSELHAPHQRPAYASSSSSDLPHERYVSPSTGAHGPPPPAPPPHPTHAHVLSHQAVQNGQYTPYASKAVVGSGAGGQATHHHPQPRYDAPPPGSYASTPTVTQHAYASQQQVQQQQQQQHLPSHLQQGAYDATAHPRQYAGGLQAPPPLMPGMGGHVDQIVPVPLPGASGVKKEKYIEVNGRPYQKLCQIGRGGSSKVFKCLSASRDLVAIKKVALDRLDSEAIKNYINEIDLLKSLRGDEKVIRLDDEETTRSTGGRPKAILVVMEFGEADFSKLLEEQKCKRLNMNFVGYFWLQMLECVKVVHDREIIHTDLKPANFVLVRGALKIIDFGISHKIEGDTVHVRRDNQIGTLNYMSPESVQRSNGEPHIVLGKPTDVWALGCILYQMIYNHLPFSSFTNHPAKVSAIISPKFQIPYPASSTPVLIGLPPDEAERRKEEMRSPVDPMAVEVMRLCFMRNEKDRPDIEQLMDHDFLKPWKRTGAPAVPKIKTLPPNTTSVSRDVLAQLVSYVRENANFSADDAYEKLEEVHRRWAAS